ncbi:MAG: AmmeMemoRadiSam system radical SAM enzyme [Planctomycetota bacterium]
MNTDAYDRRKFLATLGRCAGGACLACGLGPLAARAFADDTPRFTREIDFYERLPGKRIQCFVCPLNCVLNDGETCFCRTRTNVGGLLYSRAYNNPCILRVDPIEKLPLHHFRPGTKTLTLGVGGCNVRCIYCQNWEQSQKMPDELKTFDLTAEGAVAAAKKKEIDTIAFSYTEPVAFLEYAKDIARAAKKAKLRVVAATAAFVNPKPLIDFAQYVDAFAISLKGFDEEFYHRSLGISLAPVLEAIKTVKKSTKCWLELTNLVVPTYNDDADKITKMVKWIRKNLGGNVPVHFARFVPMYRLANLPRTPVQTLETACDAARKAGLRFVYTSNISPHPANNTYCPWCDGPLVQRLGFKTLESKLEKGNCPKCRKRLPGVWI